MPGCKVMSLAALKTIDQFSKAGGTVIWLNSVPTVATITADQAEFTKIAQTYKDSMITYTKATVSQVSNEVSAVVAKPLTVSGSDSIYVSPQVKNGHQFYYIVNTASTEAQLTFTQKDITGYTVYNPVDGSISTVNGAFTLQGYRGVFVEANFVTEE